MKVIGILIWGIIAIGLAFGIYAIIKNKAFPVIAIVAAVVLFLYAWSWMFEQLFRVTLFGNAVKLYKSQHPEIYSIVEEQCASLGIKTIPDVLVVKSDGLINALALRFYTSNHRYIILYSSLVDLHLQRGRIQELAFVIGHELGHIAAGHLSRLRNLLLFPGKLLPFVPSALSRAQELTADRFGGHLCGKQEVAEKALMAMASGSISLADYSDSASFVQQENEMVGFFAWLSKIYSSYPRLTIRVKEMGIFFTKSSNTITSAPNNSDFVSMASSVPPVSSMV
jgi:Zn-dependent protease with chaperone function